MLAILTITSQVLLVIGFLYFLLFRKEETNPIINFFSKNGLLFAFIISLFATTFSLFYSEIAGFEPCKLCWLQRIFIYPQIFILGLALLKKDYKIVDYGMTLTIAGGLISLYHNYIYYGGTSIFPCNAFGLGISCTRRYVFEFGFVTIPLMSLTSFLLIFGFLWLRKSYNQR
jgi:disulfide bond formation protein DsbB